MKFLPLSPHQNAAAPPFGPKLTSGWSRKARDIGGAQGVAQVMDQPGGVGGTCHLRQTRHTVNHSHPDVGTQQGGKLGIQPDGIIGAQHPGAPDSGGVPGAQDLQVHLLRC